ncbi:MAG: GNAT family N-acetyltransferase [Acidobacteria bacterium]|nr:GNAT family N-acetyltransferase [Acidobacteriota bacterium]
MLSIHPALTPDEIETVRSLFLEYQRSIGTDLCFQGFAVEVQSLPGDYAPPGGRLLLAAHGGLPVGCIALHPFRGSRGEMKRLFVRPSARGLGVGRALVARVLEEARHIGYTGIVLDTLPTMTEAQRLYESLGFGDIPPYRDNPVAGARFMGLDLGFPVP